MALEYSQLTLLILLTVGLCTGCEGNRESDEPSTEPLGVSAADNALGTAAQLNSKGVLNVAEFHTLAPGSWAERGDPPAAEIEIWRARELRRIELTYEENDPRRNMHIAHIKGGTLNAGYEPVGAVLEGDTPAGSVMVCSGTLVSCNQFLTARHCFGNQPDLNRFRIFLQHAGVYGINHIESYCPDGTGTDCADGDLALVTLDQFDGGIQPYQLAPTRPVTTPASAAQPAVVVGFGISNTATSDTGVKRRGDFTVADCPDDGTGSLCFTLGAQLQAHCFNDSGAPMLVDNNAAMSLLDPPQIAGVARNSTADCNGEGRYTDINHPPFKAWLEDHITEFTSCGQLRVEAHDSLSLPFSGSQTLELPLLATNDLRVMFNYGRRSPEPAITTLNWFDMAITGAVFDNCSSVPGQIEACAQVQEPVADTIQVSIAPNAAKALSSGDGQIVITSTESLGERRPLPPDVENR